MAATGQDAPAQSAAADREIVITRVISAPRELVFQAFTEVRHLARWWGPEGFTTTTRAFEFRVGGVGLLSQLEAEVPFRSILEENLPGFADD